MVTGQYLPSQEISIKVAALSGGNSDWRSEVDANGVLTPALKKNEHVVMFQVPKGTDSVYGFRLNEPEEPPIYGRVNLPEIWWTLSQGTSTDAISGRLTDTIIAQNSTVQVVGRCLSHDGKPDMVLLINQSNNTITPLKARLESPYDLSVTVPSNLVPGMYNLVVSGGPDDTQTRSATYRLGVGQEPLRHHPDSIYLDKFGVVGDGVSDNSPAFERALSEAAKLNICIIRIPAGLYKLTKPLQIPPGVYLLGSSRDESALYFADSDSPPNVWVSGKHDFGLINLSVFCGNHHTIVSSDMSGDVKKSGHVRLKNILIRGDCFSGHISAATMASRSAEILKGFATGFEAVRLSGPDLEIEDSDVLGSGSSFTLFRAEGAVIRRNRFYNGRFGCYYMGASEEVLFTHNEIEGADLSSTGGSYSVPGYAKVSKNIYTAENTYSRFRGWDSESFTSDGGGGAYFGPAVSSSPTAVDLNGDAKWGNGNWTGTLLAVTGGRGLGQWRTLKRWSGRHVEVEEPFDIPLDETSNITIVPLQLRYIFYKNHTSDAGVAIQFYGAGIEHIADKNESVRAGGVRVYTLNYFDGVQPQINIQLMSNQISGFKYQNTQPDLKPGMSQSAIEIESHPPSSILGLVVRNNSLGQNCPLYVRSWSRAGLKNVLIEGNHLTDKKEGLQIDAIVASEVFVNQP
jgi:hypothetical protein